MAVKTVDPRMVSDFQTSATGHLKTVQSGLQDLVITTATVDFHGRNAHQFKSGSSDEALVLARECTIETDQLAKLISRDTTRLSTAMGGPVVTIALGEVTISRPDIEAATDRTRIDTDAMRRLQTTVASLCGQMREQITATAARFRELGQNGGFEGKEYDRALQQLELAASALNKRITRSESDITSIISTQINRVDV